MLTLPECCYISGFGNAATSASNEPGSPAVHFDQSFHLIFRPHSTIQLLWSTSARESTQTRSDTPGTDPPAGPAAPACQQFARLLVALLGHQGMRNIGSRLRSPAQTHHPHWWCFL